MAKYIFDRLSFHCLFAILARGVCRLNASGIELAGHQSVLRKRVRTYSPLLLELPILDFLLLSVDRPFMEAPQQGPAVTRMTTMGPPQRLPSIVGDKPKGSAPGLGYFPDYTPGPEHPAGRYGFDEPRTSSNGTSPPFRAAIAPPRASATAELRKNK
ncbi:hypothetical protein BX600DRAFT_439369 [Xylariales sp. PMI_506]|nr:hypothetical protein BX600DRAFT_439369 [Xylariales sp. PMI_506]